MDKWAEAAILRDTDAYKERFKRFNAALESYYQKDASEVELEELMLAAYNMAHYIRAEADEVKWEPRQYGLHVGNALMEAVNVVYSDAVVQPLAVEVQKLEALSRSIYEYIRRKKSTKKRTM